MFLFIYVYCSNEQRYQPAIKLRLEVLRSFEFEKKSPGPDIIKRSESEYDPQIQKILRSYSDSDLKSLTLN